MVAPSKTWDGEPGTRLVTSTEFGGDNATHGMLTVCVLVSKMQDQDYLEDTQNYMHVEKMVHGGTISRAKSSWVIPPAALHFFLDEKGRHLCYVYVWSLER